MPGCFVESPTRRPSVDLAWGSAHSATAPPDVAPGLHDPDVVLHSGHGVSERLHLGRTCPRHLDPGLLPGDREVHRRALDGRRLVEGRVEDREVLVAGVAAPDRPNRLELLV